MICSVFKSPKKRDAYLYIPFDNKFDELPDALILMWGKPELVMHINLDEREKLALADISEVRAKLKEEGYYLQMPPSEADLAAVMVPNNSLNKPSQ